MQDDLKQRIIKYMEWSLEDHKWRFDQVKAPLDDGSIGGYSAELQDGIDALEELKNA